MDSNDSNLLHAHNKYFSYIRQSDEYYKFSQVGKDILAHRATAAPAIATYGAEALNHDMHPRVASFAIFSSMAAELVIDDYPLYYLSKAVIEDFIDTDLSNVSEIVDTKFKAPLPLVFVAFPQKLLTDNMGDHITHAFIKIVKDKDSGRQALKVACNLRRTGMPPASLHIATDYTFEITDKGLSYGRLVGKEDSKEALESFEKSPEGRLASIACQIMLTLSLGDEYVDDGNTQSRSTKKPGRSAKSPKIPRTIRFPETKQSQVSVPFDPDSSNLRQPHWRRGHWRNQAYGPKLSLRKVKWIRPNRIGKKAEQSSTAA